MIYDITISNQGFTFRTVQGIEAPNASDAIVIVEKQYPQRFVQLLGPKGTFRKFLWTGLEFQARQQLEFSLS